VLKRSWNVEMRIREGPTVTIEAPEKEASFILPTEGLQPSSKSGGMVLNIALIGSKKEIC
jgi:hypothetical protein